MKPRYFLGALLALALTPGLRADTITLKSGEKLEGKITEETNTEITVEVKISASINDTRTIAKADVASVDKPKPDELAYQALASLQLGPNSQPAATYAAAIQALQGFANLYPQSPHAEEIAKRLAAFTEEQHRTEGGEVKIAGHWLTKEEATRERYQISGQILWDQMQDQARRNDLVGALNTEDQIEKSFPGARVMPDAIELNRQLIGPLKTIVERSLVNLKARKTERDNGLKMASPEQRQELTAAIAREEKQNEATFQATTLASLKWPPLVTTSEKILHFLKDRIATEEARLKSFDVDKMRESLQASDKGAQQLDAGDTVGALETFRHATSLWNANEAALRLAKVVNGPQPVHAKPATPEATPAATPEPVVAVATPVPVLAPTTEAPAPEPEVEETTSHVPFYTVVVLLALGGGYLFMRAQKKKRAAAEGEEHETSEGPWEGDEK